VDILTFRITTFFYVKSVFAKTHLLIGLRQNLFEIMCFVASFTSFFIAVYSSFMCTELFFEFWKVFVGLGFDCVHSKNCVLKYKIKIILFLCYLSFSNF